MKKTPTTYEIWGRQCGEGWNQLVDPLERTVVQFGGTILQVKEKFGQLCFYYSLPSRVPDAKRKAFAKRVRRVQDLSVSVCETCGKPGELVSNRGIYFTACNRCQAKRTGAE